MLGLCLASLLSQSQVLENVPMVGRGKEWRGVSGTEPKLLGFLRMVERALHLVLQAFQEMFPLWEQQLSLGFKRLRAPESSCPPAEHSWSSRVKPVRGASQAVSGRSSGSHCRGEQTEKVFTRNHSHLKKKRFQSQRHILSALLPEKSVCRGVMLWSYPAYSEVPVLASLSCWAAWVSWNAASG